MKDQIKIKKLMEIAKKMIGTPYKYGTYLKPSKYSSRRPTGVDCSSFIQYAYGRIGIELPRSSILQATKGREIKKTKYLQRGDLIFFETTKGHYWHLAFPRKKTYIGHVVLYAGNGNVLEASEDRNNARIAKVKLQNLRRLPGYRVVLMKRIIGFKPSSHQVPLYSQLLDVKDTNWKKRSCGIIALKMVMDFWSKETHKEYPAADELIKKYHRKAYISNVGWSHNGLVQIAKSLGLKGENLDLARHREKDAIDLLEARLQDGPVIASIHKNLNPRLPGHLVTVTKIANKEIFYNDPISKTRSEIKKIASVEKFSNGWKKRIIIMRPKGHIS